MGPVHLSYVLRWMNISIFIVTYVVSVMCSDGAVKDDGNAKHTVTKPFGVVMITFFFLNVWQKFALEFELIMAGSDKKCIHQNDSFQFLFCYQNQLILSTVFYPNKKHVKLIVVSNKHDIACNVCNEWLTISCCSQNSAKTSVLTPERLIKFFYQPPIIQSLFFLALKSE